jgi:hypothetical protein
MENESKLYETEFDAITGETNVRELTPAEISEIQKAQKKEKAEAKAKAEAHASALAKLAALGLTEAEIASL